MSEKLYTVGKIVNTHGLKGEIKIVSQTDFPEVRFQKDNELLLEHPELSKIIPLQIESSRIHKNTFIVKFKGLNDINEAEKYKGGVLKVSEKNLVELPEDQYYFHEIIGCKVITDTGEELGSISEILTPGANDVWVVKRPKGNPILVPVIDDVLLNVDVKQKLVTIHLLEGLV